MQDTETSPFLARALIGSYALERVTQFQITNLARLVAFKTIEHTIQQKIRVFNTFAANLCQNYRT